MNELYVLFIKDLVNLICVYFCHLFVLTQMAYATFVLMNYFVLLQMT